MDTVVSFPLVGFPGWSLWTLCLSADPIRDLFYCSIWCSPDSCPRTLCRSPSLHSLRYSGIDRLVSSSVKLFVSTPYSRGCLLRSASERTRESDDCKGALVYIALPGGVVLTLRHFGNACS